MENTEQTAPAAIQLRPTFLTVLCVLTFIGSGWGIVSGIRTYATADSAAAMVKDVMDQAKDKIEDQPNSAAATRLLDKFTAGVDSPDFLRKSGIIKLVSCIFTLLGGILMWQLRKFGFYSYIFGTALAIILPLVMLGNAFIGGMAAAGSTFVGVIFIVLYAVNLKYLTK